MSLFKGFGTGPIIKGPFGREIFDKGPSLTEKVNIIFKDVETEGKKQGYKRAASEYDKVFRDIQNEYKQAKELIQLQKSNYGNQSEKLIEKLSELEKQKKVLEELLERKAKAVSKKYDIPIGEIRRFAASGSLISINSNFGILDLIYSYKEKKLRKAEQVGYLEAKRLYEKKIAEMKTDLQELKKNGNADIKKLIDMIRELFDAIAEEQMKIADLKILL